MELIPGVIPAPQVEPRTKGALLTSAIKNPDTDGVDWRKGIVAWPESAPSYRVVQDCTDEAAVYGDEGEYAPIGARPFVIQTVTHCPKGSIEAMAARAEAHLRAITSRALAHELWTGEATALDAWTLPENQVALGNQRPAASGTADEGPYLNPSLVGAPMISATYTDPTAALGAVEAEVSERLAGGPVYLHVPPDFITSMGADISAVGDLLQTPLGGLVVADAGYGYEAGYGPADDMTIYGTGPVQVWFGDVTVYDRSSWVVDHETNRVAVWAERPALIWFDPQTLVGCTVGTA